MPEQPGMSQPEEIKVDNFFSIFDRWQERESSPAPDLDSLGQFLRTEFETAAGRRQEYEEEWLQDLRDYKGIYSDKIQAALNEDPNRCQGFIRYLKVKVDSLRDKFLDMIFPANGDKNWSIAPSPEPSVPDSHLQQYVTYLQEKGEDLQGETKDSLTRQLAEQACSRMSTVMEDQLMDNLGRPSYREDCAHVAFDALLHGTGVLKGPLVDYSTKKRWVFSDDEQRWIQDSSARRERRPFKEAVPIWSIYPDLDVTDRRQARYIWQTHLMSGSDLDALSPKAMFKTEIIAQYKKDNPDGDATWYNFESTLRTLSDEGQAPALTGRYRVLERWGWIRGDKLADAGVDIPEEGRNLDYAANVWLMGHRVIKAVLEPVKGVPIPYHFFYFHKDASSIFGEGVARVGRDPQSAFNGTFRAMMDNAALSSGPQFGVNQTALSPDQEPTDIGALKVWLFDSAEDMQKAMQIWDIPNHVNNYLALIKTLADLMDEVTIPRYTHGDAVRAGGRTSSGLSMLMGAAHVVLKGLVRNWDDHVTMPFLTGLFHWNMQFNPREDIKGDYQIKALGATSLVAKELQAEKLLQAAQVTENPRFEGRLKDDVLLSEIFKAMDVKPTMVRTDEEFEAWRERKLQLEARAQSKANLETLLDEAQGRGLDPNQVLERLLREQMQAQLQGNQNPGQAQAQAQPAQGAGQQPQSGPNNAAEGPTEEPADEAVNPFQRAGAL